jgi:hypothetical protein
MLGYYLQLAVRSLRRNPALTTLMAGWKPVADFASAAESDERGLYLRWRSHRNGN